MSDPTWKTLPIGCGGLFIHFDIAPDGTAVATSDVGLAYVFSGKLPADMTDPTKTWVPIMTNDALKNSAGSGVYAPPGGATTWNGALDIKVAYSRTQRLYAIFPKNGGASYTWSPYYSDDSGAHWTQSNLTIYAPDGGSNGTWRRCQDCLAVDPNNENVVFAGVHTFMSGGGSPIHVSSLQSIQGAAQGTTIGTISGGTGPYTVTDGTGQTQIASGNLLQVGASAPTIGQHTITIHDTGIPAAADTTVTIYTVPSSGCFMATDGGATFDPLTTNGSTPFPPATSDPGCFGIVFDNNYAPSGSSTTTVGGVLHTKRCIVPIGGADVYETLDGTASFSATGFATAAGRSDFAIMQAKMDFDGVIYCLVTYAGANGFSAITHVWRYAGSAARGPASGTGWQELGTATGFPVNGSFPTGGIFGAPGNVIVVDPRNGHQGFVSVFGPNGIGNGYTSTNANVAAANSVAWIGSTGGAAITLKGPDYDVPYLSHIITNGSNSFTDAADCKIDLSGNQWWCGNQGALWLSTQSDFSTPQIMSYSGGGLTSYHVTVSRGTEATVAQEVIRPPGWKYPLVAMQDVGIHQSFFTQGKYASDWIPSPSRSDATGMSWAPNNYAHVAARICKEGNTPLTCGLSGYFSAMDDLTSWKLYATQPDPLCAAVFTGSIDASQVLTVSAWTSGNLLPGSEVYTGSAFNTDTGGYVLEQLTNTNGSGIPYREGTYQLSTGAAAKTSQTMSCWSLSVGGQVVVLDEDHHLVTPFNSGASQVSGGSSQKPVFMTSKARDLSDCQWSICYDLPAWNWPRRGYSSGTAAKPLAADQVTAGTAYAVQCASSGTVCTFWKTTNYGANWSTSGLAIIDPGTTSYSEPLLIPVRANAGHLFFTSFFTVTPTNGLWFSNDGAVSWNAVSLPVGYTRPQRFAVGAPYGGYPKLYYQGSNGTTNKVFGTTFNPMTRAVNWQVMGPTGITSSDFPPQTQLSGITTLTADPVVPDLLFSASGSNGFDYFGDTQVPVHLHW